MTKRVEKVDTKDLDIENQKVVIDTIRDDEKKITLYSYKIFIREKETLEGTFTRDEMNQIYQMYSSYGANLTQRDLSRQFPQFSLVDFKRILRAFNITKGSAQFAPHMIEEYTEEELIDIALRVKENNILKRLEQDIVRRNEKLVKDLTAENHALKSGTESLNELFKDFFGKDLDIPSFKPNVLQTGEKVLMIHLADLHIGAKVSEHSMFGNQYGYDVIKGRLTSLVDNLPEDSYDLIVVNLLGDMLDGMDHRTCSRTHELPQDMDNYEQVDNYLELMEYFFLYLKKRFTTSKIQSYSVKCGNHDGITAYAATQALYGKLQHFHGIDCCLFKEFFGAYDLGKHTFVITHGKDDRDMKRGMPLNLEPALREKLTGWLSHKGIMKKHVHFIKGDLHQENLNSTYQFDYRNVLSLFGSSDHSQMNYSRNNYGVSYEIISTEGELMRGSLIDL